MAITCVQIPVPATGVVTVFSSTSQNSNTLSVRNIGTSTVFLGNSSSQLFPLLTNEIINFSVRVDDTLIASGGGNTGSLAVLGV